QDEQSRKDALAREAQSKQQEAHDLSRDLSGAESELTHAQAGARSSLRNLERDSSAAAEARGRIAEAQAELAAADARLAEAKASSESAESAVETLRSRQSELSEDVVRLRSELAQV